MKLYGALEAGGTKMVCAIGDENGNILERVSIPTGTPENTMPPMIEFFKGKGISALGIGCFGLSLLFQLITLPVEFNASRRALAAIESGELLTEEEQRGARKTLTAAAMTYVAATAVALMQLLRLIMIFGGGRRRD